MLPIVDYGTIAIVIPKVSAVGSIVEKDGKYGFEVFLNNSDKPVIIGYFDSGEAQDSRKELVGIIAQYYYVKELGPDFEFNDLLDDDGEEDLNDDDKKIRS